ncbi:MAG: glycosyl transferase [Micrococcales bacterium]|nr:glycosyl transferase [Micrococcales bacterium]
MPRPHIAYIAWGFPPSRGGGTYRQLATANAFAKAGWRVTVITVEREVFIKITGADESLEAHIDPSIELIRTAFPWPFRNLDRSTWSLFHRVSPKWWRRWRKVAEQLVYPDFGYAMWLPTVVKTLKALHRKSPIDLVLATGNPYSAFGAAHRFWRGSKVPYVLDNRDAWTLNVFSGEPMHGPKSRVGKLEKRQLDAATQLWYVNQGILDYYSQRYPEVADRCRLVANGWDAELLTLGSGEAPASDTDKARPLTFGYLGTISDKVPIPQLLDGWRQAKEEGLIPTDAVLKIAGYIGFFGARPNPNRDPVAGMIWRAKPDGIEVVGPVPKTESGQYYAGIDINVLAIGGGKFVTSGKVFEYMATGKPIVSVHPPGAGASQVLQGYPLWLPISEVSGPEVARALGEAATLLAEISPEQVSEAQAFAAKYERQTQLAGPITELTRQFTKENGYGSPASAEDSFVGFSPLPRRGVMVTNDTVNSLRDDQAV